MFGAAMPAESVAQYTERFERWSATSADTWQTKDLAAAPFLVPANAVVEIAVRNLNCSAERWGGVRAVGSSLERRFQLHEAESSGADCTAGPYGDEVVVMHVQTNASSDIQHYSDNTTDVDFILLGYWDDATYVETFDTFTAGVNASWQDVNLSAYGVGAGETAEIVFQNTSAANERDAGARTNGSSLARTVEIHEAESGGVDTASMMVVADATANATIEAYAEINVDISITLVGYWSRPPGSYTELFTDAGSPASDSTWQDLDLTGAGVPDGAVAEFSLANEDELEPNYLGIRANGSSLERRLELHESEGLGGDFGRMHVQADDSATVEFYHEDVSDPHSFYLLGYWQYHLTDHDAGQESDALTGSGQETNAELFAFKLNPGSTTFSVTDLTFSLSNINCLSDGDWAGVEIIVDTNGDGSIGAGETSTVGGTGVVDLAAGTITFSTGFDVTASTNYILRVDFAKLSGAETVKIALTAGNITATTSIAGTASAALHAENDVHSGLAAYWRLDDATGSTATDLVAGVNGTLMNMEEADWVTGRRCGALNFDGSPEYVQTTSDLMQTLDDMTIALWFKTDTTTNPHHMIWQGPAADNGWGEPLGPIHNEMHVTIGRFDTNDVVGFFYGETDELAGSCEVLTAFTDTSAWHHVAVTFSNASGPTVTGELFLDGVSMGSDTGTQVGRSNWDTNIRLGRPGQADRYFDGQLDDVRIYNRVLADAEIEALAARFPTIIDLDTLSADPSLGFAISGNSTVAGFDEDAVTDDETAWLWEDCALTNLGTLGGVTIQAYDVNDAGVVVGAGDVAGGDTHAFSWTSGGGLVDLGVLAGRDHSEALGINSINDIVGTSFNFNGSGVADPLAFLHLPTARYSLPMGMNSLGSLGGNNSVGTDVNDSGEVVGGSRLANGNMRPFLWLPSAAYSLSAGLNDLGTLGGESGAILHRAEAINSNGELVGASFTAAGDMHAFLWLPADAYGLVAGMNDLGVLTGGTTSFALGINDSGQVVGASEVTGGAYHAFLWESGTLNDLNDLIDTNSPWVLTRALDINGDGEITGFGNNLSGDTRGFVVTMCAASGAGGGPGAAVSGSSPGTGSDDETGGSPGAGTGSGNVGDSFGGSDDGADDDTVDGVTTDSEEPISPVSSASSRMCGLGLATMWFGAMGLSALRFHRRRARRG